MKITLDLPSVITGGAVALALGLVAGFTPQVTRVPSATNVAPRQITGQFSPHPSDFVWLEAVQAPNGQTRYDSQLLTVPAGKVLVLTGLSASSGTMTCSVTIDGLGRTFSFRTTYGSSGSAMAAGWGHSFSNGIPLVEGQTVQLRRGTNNGSASLHGYWADA